MRNFSVILLVTITSFLASCASKEYYSTPDNFVDYAIIDDQKYIERDSWGAGSWARIVSVDRMEVHKRRRLLTADVVKSLPDEEARNMEDIKGIDIMNAIPLSPGEHKLLVEVCETDANVLSAILMTPYMKCAKAVVRLNAEPHGRYLLGGSVSKNKDHADIWIDDLRDGSLAVEKVRVKGLKVK